MIGIDTTFLVQLEIQESESSGRFSMDQAVGKAGFWWSAREIERVFPSEETVVQFVTWMREHEQGRMRLLDTMLAATYYGSGITTIATSNARDYRAFGAFELIDLSRSPTS